MNQDKLLVYAGQLLARVRPHDRINFETLDFENRVTYAKFQGETVHGAILVVTFNYDRVTVESKKIESVVLYADGQFKFTCYKDGENEPEFILDG